MSCTASAPVARAVLEASLPDWLKRDGQRLRPFNTSANLAALMQLGGWTGRYNEMTHRTELACNGGLSTRDDDLNTNLTRLGDWAVVHGLSRESIAEFVDAIGRDSAFHPVRTWVESTAWDGQDRREALLGTLILTDPRQQPLAARLLHKWMLQGIGALYEFDGLTANGMLVLAGPQFAGKTHWVRHLVPLPGAVAEGVTVDPDNKDTLIRAIGAFLVEVGELDGTMRKADIARLKGFLTNNQDEIRLPYAKRSSLYKRRTLFVGTVNGTGFLVDDTGNRRFWVIDVERCSTLDAQTMQQVWAQYLSLYRQGERWSLESDLLGALNTANQRHEQLDPLAERILCGFDWGSVQLSTVSEANRTQHHDLCWHTATHICDLVGIQKPSRAEVTRAAAIVKGRWASECQTQGLQNTASLLDRRANGSRLIAVPKKRASSGYGGVAK
jgi:putative DNA primase/helicase